jgi:hypothetical protein
MRSDQKIFDFFGGQNKSILFKALSPDCTVTAIVLVQAPWVFFL